MLETVLSGLAERGVRCGARVEEDQPVATAATA
jgi:hypothetical protein